MKVESRIFLLISAFCFVMAAVYGVWTDRHSNIEPVGVAALILSGGLLGLSGSFFHFISRRIDLRPEDREDAEIAEGAGELGFFSPGSYWPLGLAIAATVTGAGVAMVQIWLMLVGVVLVLFTVSGLVFEYYIGGRQPLR